MGKIWAKITRHLDSFEEFFSNLAYYEIPSDYAISVFKLNVKRLSGQSDLEFGILPVSVSIFPLNMIFRFSSKGRVFRKR